MDERQHNGMIGSSTHGRRLIRTRASASRSAIRPAAWRLHCRAAGRCGAAGGSGGWRGGCRGGRPGFSTILRLLARTLARFGQQQLLLLLW